MSKRYISISPGGVRRAKPIGLTLWLAARAFIQGLFSIAVARHLGANDFGVFVASVALASGLIPWLGLGLTTVMVQRIAAGSALPKEDLMQCLRWFVFTLPVLSGIGFLLTLLVLPNVGQPALLVIAAELLGAFVEPVVRFAQGQQDFNRMGSALLGLSLCRLAAAGIIWTVTGGTLLEFCWCYLLLNAGYAAALLAGLQRATFKESVRKLAQPLNPIDGIPFAIMASADKLSAEFDKTALVWAGLSGVAGNYSAAYRLTDLACLPITAAIETAVPVFFSVDPNEQGVIVSKLLKMMRLLLPLALLCGGVLYVMAPAAVWVFGRQYQNVPEMLRCLSLLPLVFGICLMVRTAAIATGLKRWCTLVECCAVSISVVVLLLTVPLFGWVSAVAVTYLNYLSMTLMFAVGMVRKLPK